MEPKKQWNGQRSFGHLQRAIIQAWKSKDIRLWKRLKTIWMYLSGQTPNIICTTLDVSRRSIFYWVERCKRDGIEGLREGKHTGRPTNLSPQELEKLAEIIDSGPIAYGFPSGIWTCPRIGYVIQEEFGISYHEHHISKLLHLLGFSVQRPTKALAKADPKWQQKWIRHTYPTLKKMPKKKKG